MGKALGFSCTLVAALALAAACTVHQTTQPPLTGPSEAAQAVRITASPDSISQDGVAKSTITVLVRDQFGNPKSGVSLRLDMRVGGQIQDFGTLSQRTVTTLADGTQSVTFTAPPPPPASAGGSGTVVSIVATPIGTNFETAAAQSVDVRLVPPGVILPPADTPTPKFTFSPTAPAALQGVIFDASSSCAGSVACGSTTGITSFTWSFGDGGAGNGVTASHAFSLAGAFNVTLTVTNDRGVSASVTTLVNISASVLPIADFVSSPATPALTGGNNTVNFDAATSTAGAGHTIVAYSWTFLDDNSTQAGVIAQHQFLKAGSWNVILTVTDDAGQTATKVVAITIGL